MGQLSVTNASREYDVRVPTIYTWLNKYSRNLKKGTRLVMEKDSVEKTILDLRNRILELEAALGRKSLESDLYKTMVELASKEYKTDLKKFWRQSIQQLRGKRMMTRFCISTSCELLGYTRQAFYKRTLSAFASSRSTLIQIIPDVISARKGRPTKGCRSIYEDVGYKWPIGRDKSVELLIDAGLGVRYPKSTIGQHKLAIESSPTYLSIKRLLVPIKSGKQIWRIIW